MYSLSIGKKAQLSYATEMWSPTQSNSKIILERIQRKPPGRIPQSRKGEVQYKDRLLVLNLLPLSYDREIEELIFLFKGN